LIKSLSAKVDKFGSVYSGMAELELSTFQVKVTWFQTSWCL